MWDGGNVAHYSKRRPQPRVLIDGLPRRAPWIDLADLRARGAAVVWTESDPHVMPHNLAGDRAAAPRSARRSICRYHRGGGVMHVGWAILPPQAK